MSTDQDRFRTMTDEINIYANTTEQTAPLPTINDD